MTVRMSERTAYEQLFVVNNFCEVFLKIFFSEIAFFVTIFLNMIVF